MLICQANKNLVTILYNNLGKFSSWIFPILPSKMTSYSQPPQVSLSQHISRVPNNNTYKSVNTSCKCPWNNRKQLELKGACAFCPRKALISKGTVLKLSNRPQYFSRWSQIANMKPVIKGMISRDPRS